MIKYVINIFINEEDDDKRKISKIIEDALNENDINNDVIICEKIKI